MKKIIQTTLFTLAALFVFAAATEATTIKAEAATTTSSKTSTKKSTKVTKYKKNQKSKNTTKTTTKKSTKKYTESKKKVTQVTTVKTTVNTKVKAKKKTVTTTVKTTVKTTKTDVATTTAATSMNIDSLSGTINPQIIKAFKTMNYKIVIDPSVSYQGNFNGGKQRITLKSANKGHLLHELGHFVAFVSGNRNLTGEFKAIYKKEADKFTGSNKAYVTKSSEEYFAESLRDYYTRPATLKAERPETYAYIEASIALLTDARINDVNAIYYL